MSNQIAIIGFGISGIISARIAIKYGFIPVIYEKNSSFGGVWLTHSYLNCKLQTTKYAYSFSDFPMPDTYPLYPTGNDVYTYLEQYITNHNLEEYVKYNSIVQSLKKVNNEWELYVNNEKFVYKNVIVSTGFYGVKTERFSNTILPNEIKTIDIFKDKNVVIIGNGPSGCDMANLSIESGAKDTTLLYRSPRWIFPRYAYSVSTHFYTWRIFLLIGYKLPNQILRLILIILFCITYFIYDSNITFPVHKPSRQNITLNENIFDYYKKGLLNYKKTNVIDVNKESIITDDTNYSYDICIDATGYKTGLSLLGYVDSLPNLYKNIIFCGDNSLGCIGFVATFNWIQISELQAEWYINVLLEKINLPNIMDQKIWVGNKTINHSDYHDYAFLVYEYMDLLYKDLYPDYRVNIASYIGINKLFTR
jgi:dimethylaniline monooxygenase (N-oxide forming)